MWSFLLVELFMLMCIHKRCLRAKEIRMSQKNIHTTGPTSFAIIREEMVICLKFSSDSCSLMLKILIFSICILP
ncbi:hypothetical protein Hanom_Chr12g01106431 [Helianthus anomalus]